MCSKLQETYRPIPFCSPIKNSPQKLKLVGLSPRRSPRINRYPLTACDEPQSPLRTPVVSTNSIKSATTFLYPVVSSTPLKLESTPIVTHPTVTTLRTMESYQPMQSCEPILPPQLNLNVEAVSLTIQQTKQSPRKAVLSELKQESNNVVEENHCERFALHNSTVTSMSESESKPIRKVKQKRKRSRSHRSSQSIATGGTQNSQINDEIDEKNLMKSDNIQSELPIELNTANVVVNVPQVCTNTSNTNKDDIVKQHQDETLANEEMSIVPMDYLSQTNSFILEPAQDDWSDPEITINTKNLLRNPLQLGGVVQQAEEETEEKLEEPDVKGKKELHNCGDGIEKSNEALQQVDEKDETDILLKSFAEENFSNDSINDEEKNSQTERKVFHGFTDPEIREAEENCNVDNQLNEHFVKMGDEEDVEDMEVDNLKYDDTKVNSVEINFVGEDDPLLTKNGRHSSVEYDTARNVHPNVNIDYNEVYTKNVIRHSSVGFNERKSSTGLAFSDDDDDCQDSTADINQDIFKLNQKLFNTSKVIEIEDVDDICSAILRQGSTPKRDALSKTLRRNRTNSNQQQQPPLSPTVITGHSTPLKRNRMDDHNPCSSPLSCKGNLRSHKTSSSDQSVPVVNLNLNKNNSMKRRATTPISDRSRKRSRTSSNVDPLHLQSQTDDTTTMTSCLQKDDLDDVFETETESHTEPPAVVPMEIVKPKKVNRKKLSIKKQKTKSLSTGDTIQLTTEYTSANNNNKLSPCIEVDLSAELFGSTNTLLDRIKRRSQKKSESSKSSSSRSCSPSRKASSEKGQRTTTTKSSRPKPNLMSRRLSPRKRQDEWTCSSPSSNQLNIKFERKKCSPFGDPSKVVKKKHSTNTSAILGDFEKYEKETSLLDDSSSSKTPSRTSKSKKNTPAPNSSKTEAKMVSSPKKKISSPKKPRLKNFRGRCDQLDLDIVSEFEAHDADLKEQAKRRPIRKCKTNGEGFFWEE